jgi:D-alanyl-D-alanine dipeptidase
LSLRGVRAPALALGLVGLACGGGGPSAQAPKAELPPPLVSLADVDPTIRLDIRYAGPDNFVGTPIDGYQAAKCLLSEPAVRALATAQAELSAQGLGLLVYDCYRPKRAVDHFLRWAADPNTRETQSEYYPEVPKEELVARGYIAASSGHSRGSTVDLTLVRLDSWGGGEPVEMGTSFDFFDERSNTDSPRVAEEARTNRQLLRAVMERHGFRNLPQEWWHYTLTAEPFADRTFDGPVR